VSEETFQLVKGPDSRKWHWYELDADECFCGNIKSFAIANRVDPGSFGERDISKTCRSEFRAATRTDNRSVDTGGER